MSEWRFHPRVRTGSDLTFGERAADKMKGVLSTWAALLGFLFMMAVWMVTGGFGGDKAPFILLNLILSTIAGLQCFVLLIAAKRSDQISSELARHDFEADAASRDMLTELRDEFAELKAQHAEQGRQLGQALFMLGRLTPPASGGLVDASQAYVVGEDPPGYTQLPQDGGAS